MATLSFSKAFVFSTEAVKTIQKQTAVIIPASANDNRVKASKGALTQFSPRSKSVISKSSDYI